ncbi:MAG TPA: carboxypeptidase-like regulatory domain-containing protein [Thermoanaerobaculia bacterium]
MLLAILLAGFAAVAEAPVRVVRLELQPVEGAAPSGVLRLTSAVDPDDSRDVRAGAETSLPAGSRWIVSGSIEGWWLQPEMLVVEPGDAPLVVTRKVWPTGRLEGTIELADAKLSPPETLTVTIEQLPIRTAHPLPRGASVVCPVDRDRRWRCDLPAAPALDLAFRAAAFVPLYRWDVAVAPGSVRKAGALRLRRGSSVSGWAQVEEKGKLANAKASLVRVVAEGADPLLRERMRRPVVTAAVAMNGFFQLAGLEPGTYSVVVEQPGFAPATLTPVEVFAS